MVRFTITHGLDHCAARRSSNDGVKRMGWIGDIVRDVRYLSTALRTINHVKASTSDPKRLLPDHLEDAVARFADRPAIWFDASGQGDPSQMAAVTYWEFDARANQIANWALELGLGPGDSVALFMNNRPEYLMIWYGLSKVGVVTALINNQLVGAGLAHCIDIADTDHLVVDAELGSAMEGLDTALERPVTVWSACGVTKDAKDFDANVDRQPRTTPPREHRAGVTLNSEALKIYTSGTTGLPKAAKVTHARALNYMSGMGAALGVKPEDRVLIVLPLYHSTGGLVGVGGALSNGASIILERKFSASRFWDVAADMKATVFIYVGELCRFLLASPPHPKERAHALRSATGNGLRPDVWTRFSERFGVHRILEFYGSTEGNVSLANFDGHPGAIGRIPRYLRHRFNIEIVKFDVESEQPVRGADGHCVRADFGEPGEAIGEIRPDDARFQFDGYAKGGEQTQKKILHDVFKPGDMWFRSGDLLSQDRHGYFYFVDRIGDTFRWKSENVATSEVAEAISLSPGVEQANVYGVTVPGYDGRAGMAALVVGEAFDLDALHAHAATELPAYARPVFVRILTDDASHTTGTFKQRKVDLVREGFDPEAVTDPLYVDDPRTGGYTRLTPALFAEIAAGGVRL